MSSGQLDFLSRLLERFNPTVPTPEPAPPRVETPMPSPGPTAIARGQDKVLTAQCAELLRQQGRLELAGRVRVCWSGRLRSTAGLAFPGKALIKLNPRLREFGEGEVQQTLLHELAHLLAHDRVGRRRIAPHGPEWQKACRDLGLRNEKRCHDLPLPRKQMHRPHHYRCQACGLEMRRVRPLRRSSACLVCCRKHSGGRYDERFKFVKVPATGAVQ